MFKKYFAFKYIFIAAIICRLFAVVFSKGYAFSDDQFETIDIAQKWLQHIPFSPQGEVYIFNLIYIGFQATILWLCQFCGLNNPQMQMLVVRFFHAILSLLTVYYGYKIAVLLTQNTTKKTTHFIKNKAPEIVAFLLGLFWIFPFLSVRSLREFFCIPFLMMGFYYVIKYQYKKQVLTTYKPLALAGLLMALAFVIRLQTMFFPLGIGLYFLLKKEWKNAILFGLFFILFLSATQFLFDYYYWGNPFASLLAYTKYNAANAGSYPNGAWYIYIFTVLGLFLFPASLLLIAGYFTNIKNRLIVFLPSLLFIVFHSYFPNKQERFIVPFFPFIIILGVVGFAELYASNNHKKWLVYFTKISIVWFLVLNTIALAIVSVTYSKKARIESMTYLKNKKDVTNILMESEGEIQFPPTFYLQKNIHYCEISSTHSIESYVEELKTNATIKPNYIIFLGAKNIEERIVKVKKVHPNIEKETVVAPSFVDNIAYYLNPKHNVNESWFIYKIK